MPHAETIETAYRPKLGSLKIRKNAFLQYIHLSTGGKNKPYCQSCAIQYILSHFIEKDCYLCDMSRAVKSPNKDSNNCMAALNGSMISKGV